MDLRNICADCNSVAQKWIFSECSVLGNFLLTSVCVDCSKWAGRSRISRMKKVIQPHQEPISSFSSPPLRGSVASTPLCRAHVPSRLESRFPSHLLSFSIPPVRENALKGINFPSTTLDLGFKRKTPQEIQGLVNMVRKMVRTLCPLVTS